MSRDGSGVYTQPFPNVVTNTTIESVVYNGFTNDVANDLNEPRPIVAGGTGATNALDALNNLRGEISKVEVTNYDSHAFQAGSFYSVAGATNAPVAGHAFAGYCYPAVIAGVATTDMFIETRDLGSSSVPPQIYIRQKVAGTWSAWMVAPAGGDDPHFSGEIFLNDRRVLSTSGAGVTDFNLWPAGGQTSDGPSIAIKVNGVTITHRTNQHIFKSYIAGGGGVDFLDLSSTAATFSVPIAAAAATVTAPAAGDNSTRVPSTAWVRTYAADAIATTPALMALPQNVRSANYTLVLGDAGKHIYHPSTDVTARVWTIPANSSVAFPIGTTIIFANQGGALTISITSDNLYLAGASSTGSRTMSGGSFASLATILKVDTTKWMIWGHGLT